MQLWVVSRSGTKLWKKSSWQRLRKTSSDWSASLVQGRSHRCPQQLSRRLTGNHSLTAHYLHSTNSSSGQPFFNTHIPFSPVFNLRRPSTVLPHSVVIEGFMTCPI